MALRQKKQREGEKRLRPPVRRASVKADAAAMIRRGVTGFT
jgi:hypothetical protein